MTNSLDNTELDLLREIGNIGAAHAATSLASLLQCRVQMSVPRVLASSIEDAVAIIPGSGHPVACVFFSFEGDAEGYIAHVISAPVVKKLAVELVGVGGGIGENDLDAMTASMLSELGNVLTGAFLNAISELTGMKLLPSPPLFAFDTVEAVMASLISATCAEQDQVLLFETLLEKDDGAIDSHLFLLPAEGDLARLFTAAANRL